MSDANATPRYTKDGLIVQFDGRRWIVCKSDEDARSCIDVLNAKVAHELALIERAEKAGAEQQDALTAFDGEYQGRLRTERERDAALASIKMLETVVGDAVTLVTLISAVIVSPMALAETSKFIDGAKALLGDAALSTTDAQPQPSYIDPAKIFTALPADEVQIFREVIYEPEEADAQPQAVCACGNMSPADIDKLMNLIRGAGIVESTCLGLLSAMLTDEVHTPFDRIARAATVIQTSTEEVERQARIALTDEDDPARDWRRERRAAHRLQQEAELAKIKAKPTPAQRDALTAARVDGGAWYGLGSRGRAGGAYSRVCKRLVEHGLVSSKPPYPITEEGLAVLAGWEKA